MAAGPWEQYQSSTPLSGVVEGPWTQYDRRDRRKPVEVPPMNVDPSEGMSGMDKFLVGAGSQFDRALRGLKDDATGAYLAGGSKAPTLSTLIAGPKPTQGEEDAALYQKYRPKGWQTTAGEMTGAAGAQAPLALLPGGLMPQMIYQGLGSAATTPGTPKERAVEGGIGAAGAGVGNILTRSLGRLFKPVGDKPKDIIDLERRGVEPTFGQTMGAKEGALPQSIGRMEETAQSVPIGGGPLRRTREKSLEQWRQATRNEALPPGSPKGTPAANFEDVDTAVGAAYDAALKPHRMPYASVTYQPDMRRLTQGLAVGDTERKMVQDVFEQLRLDRMSNPKPGVQVGAEGAQQVESALKKKAAQFMNSQDPAQQEVGKAFQALADEYGATWRGAIPPDAAAAVKAIDRNYPAKLAIEQAGRRVGAKVSEGVPENYTPTVLTQAVKSVDRSPNKSRFLRDQDAPQQQLARQGQHLLPKVSDSGSPERGMSMAVMAGLADAGNLATLGLPALYGTRPVQQWMTGRALPSQQEFLLQLLRSGAPLGAAAGAGATEPFSPFGESYAP